MSTRALYNPLPSGQRDMAVPSDYIDTDFIKVYSRNHTVGLTQTVFSGTLLVEGTHYTFLNPGMIRLTTPADGNTDYLIARHTQVLPLVTQQPGVFSSAKVNLAILQALHLAEEAQDGLETPSDLTLRTELATALAGLGSDMVATVLALTGATARTARQKMGDAVSVKDFGAKGDNVAFDVAAFQLAADSGAPSIYVPAGIYYLPDAVNINTEGQVWHGPGTLRNGGSRPCLRLYGLLASVSGLTFTGNSTVASSVENVGGGLVRMLGDNQLVAGCTFTGYRHGVEARGHNAPMIFANRFVDGLSLATDSNGATGTAISYRSDDDTHCFHGQIIGNYINGGFGFGIDVFAEDSTSPSGAYDTGTSDGGIHGTIIQGNVVTNGFAYGINLYRRGGSATLSVDRSIVEANYVAGIRGSTSNPSGGLIYGTGIYVQGAEDTQVVSNYVRDCCRDTESTLLSASGIGILNVARGRVHGNIVTEIGTLGSPLEGGGGIVHKATNVTPTYAAAGFGENPETGNVSITNNLVFDTRLESILSADSVGVVVENNHCFDAGATGQVVDGVRVYRSGGGQFATDYLFMPDPTVRENTIRRTTRYGVYADGTEGHVIDDNRITDTVSDGTRIDSAGPGSNQGNVYTNCPTNGTGFGLRILSNCSADQIVTGNLFRGGNGPAQLLSAVPALIRNNVHVGAHDIAPVTLTITNSTSGTNILTTSDSLTTKRLKAGARFTLATGVGGLTSGTVYFIREVISPTTFTVCSAIGGAAITLTTAGPVSILATFGPTAMRLTSARGSDDNGWWRVADLDTAPNIGHCNQVKLENTGATLISSFTSLRPNEPFAIWTTNNNTTLDFTGSSLVGNGGVDLALPANKILNVFHSGSLYYVAT